MEINYLAVLVAAIAVFIFGFLWYSPMLFGNLWMKLSKISPEDIKKSKQKGMGLTMAVAFIGQLVMAYVLAHVLQAFGSVTLVQAIQGGFWIWLGFIATFSLGAVLWENMSLKLYALTNAYQLIGLLIMSTILTFWQ